MEVFIPANFFHHFIFLAVLRKTVRRGGGVGVVFFFFFFFFNLDNSERSHSNVVFGTLFKILTLNNCLSGTLMLIYSKDLTEYITELLIQVPKVMLYAQLCRADLT